jgi:hypothetical protein
MAGNLWLIKLKGLLQKKKGKNFIFGAEFFDFWGGIL